MRKIQVGDRVKIIADTSKRPDRGIFIGKTGVVSDISRDSVETEIIVEEITEDYYFTEDEIVVVDELPTKLYQLYEHYSKEENRKDMFIYNEGREEVIVLFNGLEIMKKYLVGSIYLEPIYERASVLDMFTTDVKPYIEEQVKQLTKEQIEKELGYKIQIVQ